MGVIGVPGISAQTSRRLGVSHVSASRIEVTAVRVAVTFLGLDLLSIDVTTTADDDNGTDPGDCTTYLLGFVPQAGDQRWESGPGGGEL